MGYVEHCNKHGQYKGDYCGECIDDLYTENARFKEALEQIAHDKPVHDGFTSMAANEIAKKALIDK